MYLSICICMYLPVFLTTDLLLPQGSLAIYPPKLSQAKLRQAKAKAEILVDWVGINAGSIGCS